MMKSDEEIGKIAGAIAKAEIQRLATKSGVTLKGAFRAIKDGLKAHEIKAQLNKLGEWTYSEKLVDHSIRLRAADMTLLIHEGYPAKRVEHTGEDGGPIVVDTGINRNFSTGQKGK